MRYAMIENGVVTNVIEWDGATAFPLPDGVTLVATDVAGIGDAYNGQTFTPAAPLPPPPPAPFDTFTQAQIAALPPAPLPVIQTVQTILAKADVDITNAELKTLTLLMMRYFLKKWLGGWR